MGRDDIISAIDEYLTKQGRRILCAIYDKEQSMSGELADYLGISRSAMSNSLERLKKAPVPIIQDEKCGRTRMYSLTEVGKDYVQTIYDIVKAEILIENSKKPHKQPQENDVKGQIVECLKELEEENEHWSDAIQYQGGIRNLKHSASNTLSDKVEQLIKLGLKVKVEGDSGLYTWLIRNINNQYIQEEIENTIEGREGLLYLGDIIEEDYEKAYRAMEILFGQEEFITAGDVIMDIIRLGITRYKVHGLVRAMQILVTEAKKYQLSKEEFKTLLIAEGLENGLFVYYIAEKYVGILKKAI